MPRYVIIGNSAGGIGAAEAIRELDRQGTIAIISDEPYPAYSRPLISEYLAGQSSVEEMLYRRESFYSENDIQALLGTKAARIGLEPRHVELENGERVEFEKLLLATGGIPFVPPIDGGKRKGVFTFTTLGDSKRIESSIDSVKRAVVIGGGLIGISVTEALVHRGIEVTVVELKDRILNVLLDERSSAIAEAAVVGAGVRIAVNATVKRIVGRQDDEESVGGVVLDSGEEIGCDVVIVAIGVIPRTELAAGAGIKANRGILVDRYMQTNLPGVYACGDVAEAYDFVLEGNRVVPIWPNAYLGGRIAGRNMAGVPTEYAGGTSMNSLKYFGLSIVSAGVVAGPESANGYEVILGGDAGDNSNGQSYRKVVLKDDRVVGMTFIGDIERSGIVLSLMRDKTDVSNMKNAIVGDDFSFASFPREVRQAKLGLRKGVEQSTVCSVDDVEEDMGDE